MDALRGMKWWRHPRVKPMLQGWQYRARALRQLCQRASPVNPDDAFHHAIEKTPTHAYHDVVQVDGRVTVAGYQPEHAAQTGQSGVAR
jgi:hypothetical protein